MFFAIQLTSALPSALVVTYALGCLFKPRDKAALWTIQILMVVVMSALKQFSDPFAFALFGVMLVVLSYLVCFEGSPFAVAVVGILAQLLQFLLEIPCGIAWIATTGLPVMDVNAMHAHILGYVSITILHTILMVIVFYGFYRLCTQIVGDRDWKYERGKNPFGGGYSFSFLAFN